MIIIIIMIKIERKREPRMIVIGRGEKREGEKKEFWRENFFFPYLFFITARKKIDYR